MLRAIGYIIFAAGVALWLAGCATAPSVGAVPAPEHTTNGWWQEHNSAVQAECDKAVAEIALEAGVTAENINDPQIQRVLRQLRWKCAQDQGLTL